MKNNTLTIKSVDRDYRIMAYLVDPSTGDIITESRIEEVEIREVHCQLRDGDGNPLTEKEVLLGEEITLIADHLKKYYTAVLYGRDNSGIPVEITDSKVRDSITF